MEIRRVGDTGPLRPVGKPISGPAGEREGAAPDTRGRDGFQRSGAPEVEQDTPFWLVRMSTDRLAGRQYLDQAAHRRAAAQEAAWVSTLVAAVAPAAAAYLAAAVPAQGARGLLACQQLANAVVAAAGSPCGPVRVVWLVDKQEGRGQLAFRLEGNLIQLKPGAGDAASWLQTVAHEAYHHVQQELVTSLYKGEQALEGASADLAAYYRDARAIYKAPSPQLPPAKHRKQALEVGAWAFAEGLVAATRRRG